MVAWFQERIARADTTTTSSCFLRSVPLDVDIDKQAWRQHAVELGSWCGYPAAWDNEGAPMLAASIPAVHERLASKFST